jgi:hypothetical protein
VGPWRKTGSVASILLFLNPQGQERGLQGFFPKITTLDRKNNIQGVFFQTGQPKSAKVKNISLTINGIN